MTTETFRCPDCGRRVTRGPGGVEYGHERGRGSTGTSSRCPRRQHDVDPHGGVEHDSWVGDETNRAFAAGGR